MDNEHNLDWQFLTECLHVLRVEARSMPTGNR